MLFLNTTRNREKLSQRALAQKSGISYKALQLIEQKSDTKLSTLDNIAHGLGYPKNAFKNHTDDFFKTPVHSVAMASKQIVHNKEKNWSIPLFDFVDYFRHQPEADLVNHAPDEKLSPRLKALLAGVTETLCSETNIPIPNWTASIFALDKPWFVSEIENLKAISLVEAPVPFRKRNIFVLSNFLDRA